MDAGGGAVLDISIATLKLTWVGNHFHGEWKQGDSPIQMELRQVADFPRKPRPQTPRAPFPYKNETLAIASTDGVTLGATLSIPTNRSHPNVVVLVHGSGPSTRHEEVVGHRTFDVLADYLARRGVAVLRYDKRGISHSTGNFEEHTAPQLAEDLNAAVQALRARKEFGHVGLIGHSEGSAIAASVAARHPESVDFVVSLAGVGLSGIDAMLLQDRMVATDNGAAPAEAARIMVYVRQYYEALVANLDVGARIAALKALYAGLSAADQALIVKYRMNEGTLSLQWAEKPFLRVVLLADPQSDWRAVRCPVLALNGSVDHQVPPQENLGGIVAALKAGGNTRVTSAVMPSLNHLFQTARTGGEDEYGKIEETMSPLALRRIGTFVNGLFRVSAGLVVPKT